MICGLRKFDRVTPSLYNLHWLPIEQRIIFKILLLVYKARSGEGPKYLKDLLLPYSAHHKGLTVQLRSSDDPTLLDTPSTDKITYGDRSFSYAGTYYWNKLPQVIRELDTLPRFKKEQADVCKTFTSRPFRIPGTPAPNYKNWDKRRTVNSKVLLGLGWATGGRSMFYKHLFLYLLNMLNLKNVIL